MSTPASSSLRVAVVQMSCGTDVAANLAKAVDRINEAVSKGAQVVCTQELFTSQYFCQREDAALFDLAETIPGPSSEALGRVAAKHRITVVGSIFEKRAAGVYHNTAIVMGPDGTLTGLYRKMHIPDDPLYFEKFYFTPGDTGFRSFEAGNARIGTLVCWDQWFPEAARLTALSGAEVLFYPTAIGWHKHEKDEFGPAQHDAWQTIQRSHAVANGIFVAVANRVGHEGTLEFWGGSFIADPFGRILAQASHDREEILIVDCDRRLIEETRRNWPFLRDRRIDAYGGLVKRYLDRE